MTFVVNSAAVQPRVRLHAVHRLPEEKRGDPPDNNLDGYNFWLAKFNGNFVEAEMVKAFIVSTEYRERFGR